MRRIALLAFVVVVGAVGCMTVRPPGSMELYDDATTMRAEVLKYVRVGTRIDQAQAVMKAHGFHCQEWAADQPEERQFSFTIAKPDPNATLLDRLSPFVHEIRVTMLCENGRVIEVKAFSYAVGS